MSIIFWGKVRQGKKRGKELGFPTANIVLHKNIPEGIYISLATLNKKVYRSLTFIGSAITFGEYDVKAETYIFEFNNDLYGKWVSIRLLKKIRVNKKFSTTKDLIKQMQKDRHIALKYFIMHAHV